MDFVFLLCSERSGSNLISKIIDAHSNFCGPSPSHMIRTFSQNILKYGDIRKSENWTTLISDVVNLLNAQLGKWHTKFHIEDLLKIEERSLRAIIRYVYETEAKANNKEKVFLKENHAYNFLTYTTMAFPKSRFIYLVRDPRDVCLSWKVSPNHPSGIMKAASVWKEDQKKSLLCYGYLLQYKKVLLVRYEDLVNNTIETVKKICKYLSINFEEDMLGYYKNDLTIENSKRLKDWKNLNKPIIKDNFNKYKKNLTDVEIKYIEYYCKEEMLFLGYQLDYPIEGYNEDIFSKATAIENNIIKPPKKITPEEQIIREKRLSVIHTIIKRNLSF